METSVRAVHVIFKTHLDIGFTDFSRTVVENYFTDFIPRAIEVARTLRERDNGDRFIWTTGSWLVYEFLERANAVERKQLEDAIVAGDIVWHGLPFTTHSELMDVSLFRYGLSISQSLDRRFGRHTIAGKMTDVPGHTRGIIPLLQEAGIQFLHLGVNPASTVPDVPPLFHWQDPNGASIIVCYQENYGNILVPSGMNQALVFAHTNDNHGPQTLEQVQHTFAELRQQFPGAEIFASTMDAFAESLLKANLTLPTVTQEIGDTWIHGVGTDPAKVSRFRELVRLRNEWLETGKVQPNDPMFDAFNRLLIMIPEHTWGLDEKTHLADYTHYDANAFAQAKSSPNFQKMEASWREQRGYITSALDALNDSPLRKEADERLKVLEPVAPDLTHFERYDSGAELETTHFRIRFDASNGSIIQLDHKDTRRDWASKDNPIGLFRYEAFSKSDFDRFYQRYIRDKRAVKRWAVDDYTKPGMPDTLAARKAWFPRVEATYLRDNNHSKQVLLKLTMPNDANSEFGSPKNIYVQVTFPHQEPSIYFDVQWFDKPASRLPEALWFSFAPVITDRRGWWFEKMGQLVSPLDVVRSGNRKLHAVGSSVFYRDTHHRLVIDTLDAPLVAPGEPSLVNFNNQQPNMQGGVHFNLYNNVWGTNFPMWYDDNARFRFALTFDLQKS